jgi:ankyrin repeat protein
MTQRFSKLIQPITSTPMVEELLNKLPKKDGKINEEFYKIIQANGGVDNELGNNIIAWAINFDDNEKFEEFLEEKPDSINSKNYNGNTPLIYAIFHQNTIAVKKIIEANKKITRSFFDEGTDENKIQEIETELLTREINSPNKEGNTPLHYAVESGNIEIVKLLLENGAISNNKNLRGFSTIDIAKELGHSEISKLL